MGRDEVRDLVEEAAERAVQKFVAQAPYACGLCDEAAREQTHLYGVLKDVGGGRYDAGIETLRSGLKAFVRAHRTVERVGGIMLYVIVAAVVGGVLKLIAWCAKQCGVEIPQ